MPIYVKVKDDLSKALKILKGKVIKSRTLQEVKEREEYIKPSVKRRTNKKKAIYKQHLKTKEGI